jgi:hypothetical protein
LDNIFQIFIYLFHLLALAVKARQYGEVVLPDESTGYGPGSPRQRGQKVVTVQGGYGAIFAVMVQFIMGSGAIAVQC